MSNEQSKTGTACPGYGPRPMTRREMLTYASNGFGLLALSSLMAEDSYAGLSGPTGPHFAPKAKNIIFCYMPGAVSHVDTFDPKPKLAELHGENQTPDGRRKWKKCPFEFHNHGQSGIPISDVFPHIATCADELAVIRSMKTGFSVASARQYPDAHGPLGGRSSKPGVMDQLRPRQRE